MPVPIRFSVAVALAAAAIAGGCDNGPGAVDEGDPAKRREARPTSPDPSKPLIGPGDRIVYFGDSLGIGGTTPFPDLLPGRLESEVAGIGSTNLGASGTTTADWLPGSDRFEGALAPELRAGAAVVLVSLGGNDLELALGGADGPAALGRLDSVDAIERLNRAETEIAENLERTIAEIRSIAPRAAIVYVSYPDYSRSARWRRVGPAAALILRAGLEMLNDRMAHANPDLIVNMLDQPRSGDVDSLLIDGEHLSDTGHALYAKRIARALLRP